MSSSGTLVAKAVAGPAVRQPSRTGSICFSCRARLFSRSTTSPSATAATATASPELQAYTPPSETTTPATAQHTPSTGTQPATVYSVRAGVVLSRPPLLTRHLTPFEKSFYLYQKRLNERLALPFTRYFYYKKGTPADEDWKRKIRARLSAARDIGQYTAYGAEGWNDEVLVGDTVGEPEEQIEALVRDAEGLSITGEKLAAYNKKGEDDNDRRRREASQEVVVVDRPRARRTAADENGDKTSLSRALDRTLYLLLKNRQGRWRFPEDGLVGREGLHDAAERVLIQAGGINMNTWVVGNAPIGHYHFDFPKPQPVQQMGEHQLGEKVFFLKARIMAGQADMSKNVLGDTEYLWLAKEEIEGLVTPRYWSSIRNMLVER